MIYVPDSYCITGGSDSFFFLAPKVNGSTKCNCRSCQRNNGILSCDSNFLSMQQAFPVDRILSTCLQFLITFQRWDLLLPEVLHKSGGGLHHSHIGTGWQTET